MNLNIDAAQFKLWLNGIPKKVFTGFIVGPFFIRSNTSDDGTQGAGPPGLWTIQNYKLNKTIKNDIPTHGIAIKYAEELVKLCSFDQEEEDDDDDYYDDNRSFLSKFFFG